MRNSSVFLIASRIGGMMMRVEARGKPKVYAKVVVAMRTRPQLRDVTKPPWPSGGGRGSTESRR